MSALADLPHGWLNTTVGAACEIAAGNGFPTALQGRAKGDLPFFKVGDISNAWRSGTCRLEAAQHYITHDEAKAIRARPLPTNAVVFAKIGEAISLNRRALLTQPSLMDNNCMGVWADPLLLDPRLLFHFLCTVRLGDSSRASVVPSLRRSDIADVPLAIPPLAEQLRIVAKIEELFSDLDAGVAALERVKANLKRYRAAVLKAAVEGRLTEDWRRRHPDTEPASRLLERILADRRAKWEQDQLRKFKESGKTPPKGWKEKYEAPSGATAVPDVELPANWIWAVADQLCGTITDGEHITPPRTNSGVFLLSARNVVDGRLRFDEVDYISPETYATLCRRLRILPGDVLMSCSGSVGRSCVAPEGLDFSLVRSVAVLKPVMPFGTFLSMAIRSILLQHQVSEKKSQTAQANIFQGKIKRLVFPLPPIAEQTEIVAEVDRRLSVADAAETQVVHALQRAARLRQAILKRAFEGKLVAQDPSDELAGALQRPIDSKEVTRTPKTKRKGAIRAQL